MTTLRKIMVDPAAPMAVKARCAYYILDQTKKAIETEEIEARVTELAHRCNAQTGRLEVRAVARKGYGPGD